MTSLGNILQKKKRFETDRRSIAKNDTIMSYGYNAVLDCNQSQEKDLKPILCEEVEIAVAALNERAKRPTIAHTPKKSKVKLECHFNKPDSLKLSKY